MDSNIYKLTVLFKDDLNFVQLTGTEIKALQASRVDFLDAFISKLPTEIQDCLTKFMPHGDGQSAICGLGYERVDRDGFNPYDFKPVAASGKTSFIDEVNDIDFIPSPINGTNQVDMLKYFDLAGQLTTTTGKYGHIVATKRAV